MNINSAQVWKSDMAMNNISLIEFSYKKLLAV